MLPLAFRSDFIKCVVLYMNSHRYAHVAALLDTVAAVFESHIATTLWRKIHPDKSQTTVKISTVNENINVLF